MLLPLDGCGWIQSHRSTVVLGLHAAAIARKKCSSLQNRKLLGQKLNGLLRGPYIM